MSAELPNTALPSYGAAAYDPSGDGTPVGVELDRLAADEPDAPAVTCNDVTLSRAELASRSNRLARHLAGLGVRRGDMVTIGLPNGWEFYVAVVAAWKLGAVPQPVSARLPAAELAALIEIADPAVVLGLETADGRPWLPAGFEPDPALDDGPLPPAVPPYWKAPTSGGSTGRPKIILAAAAGTAEAIVARAGATRVDRGSVLLVTAPLYHNAPLTFSLMALVDAGHVVVMERFDPADVLDRISRHRATWVYAVPTLMGRMLRLPAEVRAAADLSSVRTLFHVGAPCPEHVKRGWLEWIEPYKVLELYAGTESIAVCTIDGEDWLRHPGSVGRPVSGELLIADEDFRPLPPGEVGEVWQRPPEGARTYHYIGATARARDGWESIGDLGRVDEDGYLYLSDRRSDMILVGGANVYPAEVEAVLESHPAVVSSAVIGLPDDDLGSVVHAIVQTTEPVDDQDLAAHVRGQLAGYKVPRGFERSATPLRDDAGKVRRTALRAARLPPR
ncbi:MAG TPA: AMP-binding protein [Pseudonocardia sp.]|uniref:AMP-binding protein n=1 Tax=Pseudonocardia sp. TaxID=60912 RepID=UPI002F3F5634